MIIHMLTHRMILPPSMMSRAVEVAEWLVASNNKEKHNYKGTSERKRGLRKQRSHEASVAKGREAIRVEQPGNESELL